KISIHWSPLYSSTSAQPPWADGYACCGWSDRDVDRTGGDRVGRGPERVAGRIRDGGAGVGRRLQEQCLTGWAGKAPLAGRAHGQAGVDLSVTHRERAGRAQRGRHGLLVPRLGMVAAIVEALVDGGRGADRERDLDARRAGPQAGVLERGGEGSGTGAHA